MSNVATTFTIACDRPVNMSTFCTSWDTNHVWHKLNIVFAHIWCLSNTDILWYALQEFPVSLQHKKMLKLIIWSRPHNNTTTKYNNTWKRQISLLRMLLSMVPPNMYIASFTTAAAWNSRPVGTFRNKSRLSSYLKSRHWSRRSLNHVQSNLHNDKNESLRAFERLLKMLKIVLTFSLTHNKSDNKGRDKIFLTLY